MERFAIQIPGGANVEIENHDWRRRPRRE